MTGRTLSRPCLSRAREVMAMEISTPRIHQQHGRQVEAAAVVAVVVVRGERDYEAGNSRPHQPTPRPPTAPHA